MSIHVALQHVTLNGEPTNGVPATLVFALITPGCGRSQLRQPAGQRLRGESGRLARFFRLGHGPGKRPVMQPMDNNELPMTLDLRRV